MEGITSILQLAEGSGRVEYKRTCLWPLEKPEGDLMKVLMRLANANPAQGGIIELGREDSGERLGLVDAELNPVHERKLRSAEQKLVQVAQRLDPPMHIRWVVAQWGSTLRTIIVLVPGRPRGSWYQGPDGVTWTGSASHPVIARQSMLRAWALEAQVTQSREDMLRREYILSHDGLSPGILAGTEPLPAAWVASRKRQLGWDK